MRLLALFISLLLFSYSFSQGFKVKEFKQNLNDGSAFHAPLDCEGRPGGLIKVRSDNPNLQFKGDIVGNVENKMNEYSIYVSLSSKELTILHPNFLPMTINYDDYGIEISSKATYILLLEETKYNKEKSSVTIVVKPENAEVHIDEFLLENTGNNGYYQLYLPKGDHICKLYKTGFRSYVQIVQAGKTSQNISVELESIMAELEVKCKTAMAEIYVDGTFKGNGTWDGEIFAGEHKVEARLQNHDTYTKNITLTEKEKHQLSIPELKRLTSNLNIESVPSGIFISVDGIPVGISPCSSVTNTGHHIIKGEGYGCEPTILEVDVNNGNNSNHSTISLQIVGNPFFEKDNLFINLDGVLLNRFNMESQTFGFDHQKAYEKAYKRDNKYIVELAMRCLVSSKYDESYCKEALYWMERIANLDNFLVLCKDYWELANGVVKAYCSIDQVDKAFHLCETMGGEFQGVTNYGYLGDLYQRKGNYSKAILCYKKSDWFFENIADCYKAIGEQRQAIYYYKIALEKTLMSDEIMRIKKKLKEIE